jgi:hypothetical protein
VTEVREQVVGRQLAFALPSKLQRCSVNTVEKRRVAPILARAIASNPLRRRCVGYAGSARSNGVATGADIACAGPAHEREGPWDTVALNRDRYRANAASKGGVE